jgi:hypothetical protein
MSLFFDTTRLMALENRVAMLEKKLEDRTTLRFGKPPYSWYTDKTQEVGVAVAINLLMHHQNLEFEHQAAMIKVVKKGRKS